MSATPWRHAALRGADLELDLAHRDWLEASASPAHDAARHEAAERALADWLRDLIDCARRRLGELAARHATEDPANRLARVEPATNEGRTS